MMLYKRRLKNCIHYIHYSALLYKMMNLTRAPKWFVVFSLPILLVLVTTIDAQGASAVAGAMSGGNYYMPARPNYYYMPDGPNYYGPEGPNYYGPEGFPQSSDDFPTPDVPEKPDMPDIPENQLGGGLAEAIICLGKIAKNIIIGLKGGLSATVERMETEPFPDSIISIVQTATENLGKDLSAADIALKMVFADISEMLGGLLGDDLI